MPVELVLCWVGPNLHVPAAFERAENDYGFAGVEGDGRAKE